MSGSLKIRNDGDSELDSLITELGDLEVAAIDSASVDSNGVLVNSPQVQTEIDRIKERIDALRGEEILPVQPQPRPSHLVPNVMDYSKFITDLLSQTGVFAEWMPRLEAYRREAESALIQLTNQKVKQFAAIENLERQLANREYEIYYQAKIRATSQQDLADLKEFLVRKENELADRHSQRGLSQGEINALTIQLNAIVRAKSNLFTPVSPAKITGIKRGNPKPANSDEKKRGGWRSWLGLGQ